MRENISLLRIKILLGLLILGVCLSHLLFLAQIDYVVYDHGKIHTAKPALKGYYQLKEGNLGDFIADMFSHHDGCPGYPAFTGYLTALACYLFGLSEVMMRWPPLLFYLILIYFTYKCAREIDSEEAGLISVFILTTMPVIVFYSRMIFPAFLGIGLYMGTLYYLLKSDYFLNIGYCLLLGLFTGFCLLTHRVMFIFLAAIWLAAAAGAIKRRRIASLKGFFLSFLTASVISTRFLIGYFKAYGELRDSSRYNSVFFYLKDSVYLLGYDNVVIFCLLMLLIYIFWTKERKILKEKTIPSLLFAAGLLCLFFVLSFVVTACSAKWLVNQAFVNPRYYQTIAPPIAIIMGIYLSRRRPLIRNTVIFIKGILLISLVIMIIPSFGGSGIMEPFKRYYYIPYSEPNGVIWSNRTFVRKEELDYFKEEISKGDIAFIRSAHKSFQDLRSLRGRLQLNGVGRVISSTDAKPSALYLFFHCLSRKRGEYIPRKGEGTGRFRIGECILGIEDFVNQSIADETGPGEKVSIIDAASDEKYTLFLKADIIAKYLRGLSFKKAACFKYRLGDRIGHFKYLRGDTTMYKVILKCEENVSELDNDDNFKGWREDWLFLRKAGE